MGRLKLFTRLDVVEKALLLFWRHGFSRTSLSDIERVTGVNKSGLYTEFKDKDDLFLACLEKYYEKPAYLEFLTMRPLGWQNIRKFLETPSGLLVGQRGCFAVNSLREMIDLPEEARRTITHNYDVLKALIRPNVEAEKPCHDVDELVEAIASFFWGIRIRSNLENDEAGRQAAVDGFMALLKANSGTN